MQNKNFHSSFFKSTKLFGLSQFIKIVAKVIVNKFAALFLGPIGIGIIGLVENLLSIIYGVVSFGIPVSSVREIAVLSDNSSINNELENKKINIIHYWSLISGILGGIVFLVVSYFFFIDSYPKKASYFCFLSLVFYFLFFSLYSSKMSILQGKRELKKMVTIQIWNMIIQIFLTLFSYYYFGINGIAIAFLFSALFSYILICCLTLKVKINHPNVISLKQLYKEGLPMIKLGLILSLGGVINQFTYYFIRLF